MIATWFGTYERQHSANRVLRSACAGAGFTVEELHVPLWEATRSKDRAYFGPRSLLVLGRRYVEVARGLRALWRARSGPPPLVFVGFGGQLDVLLAHRVCRPRRGLVFAPLVSLTETLVEDRGLVGEGSAAATALRALDRWTFRLADGVLADTQAHAAYLRRLGAERVAVWPLGVEPEFLGAPPETPAAPGRVLFYGRHVPLHGVDVIVAAAARLKGRARFRLIGTGPGRAAAEAQAREAGVEVEWVDDVPLSRLTQELAEASVVLGVFSPAGKAAMVVPNKVYQAAAAGRPLVTREAPALREFLSPGAECVAVPAGDPAALADAIAALLADPQRASRLGDAARQRVLADWTPAAQAERLRTALGELGLLEAGA